MDRGDLLPPDAFEEHSRPPIVGPGNAASDADLALFETALLFIHQERPYAQANVVGVYSEPLRKDLSGCHQRREDTTDQNISAMGQQHLILATGEPFVPGVRQIVAAVEAVAQSADGFPIRGRRRAQSQIHQELFLGPEACLHARNVGAAAGP